MNYLKIQQNLLKAVDAKHKSFNTYYCVTEDKVWVIHEGVLMMGIPKNLFYLDVDKIWKDIQPFKIETLFKDTWNLKSAVDTNTTIQVTEFKKKLNLHKFVVDGEEVYIQEKYLEFFDPDARFEGRNSKAPLYVYENDEFVGLILPWMKKNGSKT